MKRGKNFRMRGWRPSVVPVTQQTSMVVPSPVTGSPRKNKSHLAACDAIMNDLSVTKSRICEVCCNCC